MHRVRAAAPKREPDQQLLDEETVVHDFDRSRHQALLVDEIGIGAAARPASSAPGAVAVGALR